MKNRLLLSGLGICLATSLNATPLFNNENEHIKAFENQILNMFNNNDVFFKSYKDYHYPKMNAFEDDKKYTFKFELPGMDKKDIKVTIKDEHILSIVATKKELSKDEKKNIIREEQYYGTVSRYISLPKNIDSNKISLSYKNGILEVVVPKDMNKKKEEVKTLTID